MKENEIGQKEQEEKEENKESQDLDKFGCLNNVFSL